MKIKYLIFDVDGTLVDSVDLHAQAWQEALRKFGYDLPFQKVRSQIGQGSDQLLPALIGAEAAQRQGEDISSVRTKLFQQQYLPKVIGFPQVRELFERLLAHGIKIALASSAAGKELTVYKEKARVSDLISAETSKDDAEKSKPHPDIFEAALERLGNPSPAETLVVGDTPYDIEAARRAGIETIAVRCGGFPEETLSGAIAIYDSPADLLQHLEEAILTRTRDPS